MRNIYRILTVVVILSVILIEYILNHSVGIRWKFSETDYSTTDRMHGNSDVATEIGFSHFELTSAKAQEANLELEYDLTAILLHWKRLDGVRKSLQLLLQSHLFKKIIVWNNNPEINLTIRHFINDSESFKLIHIFNSKRNTKDEAKYRACAMATTRACFYVDDDWNASGYIKSLVASFRSDPNVLHAVTNAYTFYTNLVWSYFDNEIDLHTGFSWIGCGSVFLRAHAQKHLQLLHKFLKNNTGKDNEK